MTWCPQPNVRIEVFKLHESNITTIDVPDVHIKAFREMVQRATNLWPDAPPEIKHFADIITTGKPMQDYFVNPNLAGTYSKPKQT